MERIIQTTDEHERAATYLGVNPQTAITDVLDQMVRTAKRKYAADKTLEELESIE